MKPDYKIINKDTGKDLTQILRPYITSISLTESVDNFTDTLTICLDGQGVQSFPASGTNIEVYLGYQKTGMASFGVYKVDTKSISGMPLKLTIKAGASDFNASYKEQKNRHWDDKTLSDILKSIAVENSLELKIDLVDDEVIKYLEQSNESDMALVTRLADEFSVYGTIKAGKLVFTSIKPTNAQAIKVSDLLSFNLSWYDKPRYDSVTANWHQLNSNVKNVEIWDGKSWNSDKIGKTYIVKEVFNSQYKSRKKAKQQWQKLKKMSFIAQLNMTGRIDIVSKMILNIKDLIPQQEIKLTVEKVTHTLNSSGYKIALDCTGE